jgi:hypothetical protein
VVDILGKAGESFLHLWSSKSKHVTNELVAGPATRTNIVERTSADDRIEEIALGNP